MSWSAVLVCIAQLVTIALLMVGCTRLAVHEFDRYGDELCRKGIWEGTELCPQHLLPAAPDQDTTKG